MSDQIEDRKAKLEKIRALGVDPYGGRFTGVTSNAEMCAVAEKLEIESGQIREDEGAAFRAAGRVGLYRAFGNLIFMTVRDRTGEIQFGLSKKMILRGTEARRHEGTEGEDREAFPDPETTWKLAKLLDLGDIIGAEGRLGRTKTGELTLWVTKLTLLGKALRPPPEKRLGLTDVEARYRRRHVDLYSNPESREVFVQRARIIDYARGVLRDRGFVEVETPVLQPIYGGAAARPFLTHHNTLDMDLYLRISPELYLKRCLVGGMERVYEISRCFRNEGISPRHNPEFTILELYQAYADYHDMMDFCEAFIGGAARDVIGSTKIKFGDREIDYTTPWPRLKYAELLREFADVDVDRTDPGLWVDLLAKAEELGIVEERREAFRESGQRVDRKAIVLIGHEVFEKTVEPMLANPTFVLDWPEILCPLTRRDPKDARVAQRFELFISGMELANAYSELNDPAIQRENLSTRVAGEGDETMRVMDEGFLEALEYGMPVAGGLGVGIDRLVMLLTGRTSIRDVILFPIQRATQSDAGSTDDNDPRCS